MSHPRTASQRVIDSMGAVLSTRAKAAAALRTAVEICAIKECKYLVKVEDILRIASELDGGSAFR